MMGKKGGVTTRICQDAVWCLTMWCNAHRASLASAVMETEALVKGLMELVTEVYNVFAHR
jgi:hypothetical protein